MRWNGKKGCYIVCLFFLSPVLTEDVEIAREEVTPEEQEREMEREAREGDLEKERTKELTASTIEWITRLHMWTHQYKHTGSLTTSLLVSDYSPLLSRVKMPRCCLRKSLLWLWRSLDPPQTSSLQSLCLCSPPHRLQQKTRKDRVRRR